MPPRLWSKWWPSRKGFWIDCRVMLRLCIPQLQFQRLTLKTFSYSLACALCSFSVAPTYSSKYPTACFQACRRSARRDAVYVHTASLAPTQIRRHHRDLGLHRSGPWRGQQCRWSPRPAGLAGQSVPTLLSALPRCWVRIWSGWCSPAIDI